MKNQYYIKKYLLLAVSLLICSSGLRASHHIPNTDIDDSERQQLINTSQEKIKHYRKAIARRDTASCVLASCGCIPFVLGIVDFAYKPVSAALSPITFGISSLICGAGLIGQFLCCICPARTCTNSKICCGNHLCVKKKYERKLTNDICAILSCKRKKDCTCDYDTEDKDKPLYDL